MQQQLITDSAELIRILSSMGNPTTGIGTARDKAAAFSIGLPIDLSEIDIESLYQNGLVKKIVDVFPDAAAESGIGIEVSSGEKQPLLSLFDRLNVVELFSFTSRQAALYGQAFLLIDLDDSMPTDRPIASNIKSIKNFRFRRDLHNSNGFFVDRTDGKTEIWHRDRVLCFYGSPIFNEKGEIEKSNSILTEIIEAYALWLTGLKSLATMLSDSSFLKVGMKGLGQVLRETETDAGARGQRQVQSRLLSLDLNRAVSRSVAYDLDNEEMDHEERTFTGTDAALDRLERFLCMCTDIPRWRLFGEESSSGLSSSTVASHLQKAGWAAQVRAWKKKNWSTPLNQVLSIALRIDKFKQLGNPKIVLPIGITLSEVEEADLELKAAQRLEILIRCGIITPQEARSCYSGSAFSLNITLTE